MRLESNSISNFGNFCIKNQKFETIKTSGFCDLDGVTCVGPLICSGKAQIKNSHLSDVNVSGNTDIRDSIADKITTSGHFYAVNCQKLGKIKGSGHTHFVNCVSVNDIRASGSLSLLNTQVNGDVSYSGNNLQISNSKITGKLECVDKVTVYNSSINEIVIKSENPSYVFEFFGIFKFSKQTALKSQNVVELIGKNCSVNSIAFAEGYSGKVILKEGATVTGKILRGVIVYPEELN